MDGQSQQPQPPVRGGKSERKLKPDHRRVREGAPLEQAARWSHPRGAGGQMLCPKQLR